MAPARSRSVPASRTGRAPPAGAAGGAPRQPQPLPAHGQATDGTHSGRAQHGAPDSVRPQEAPESAQGVTGHKAHIMRRQWRCSSPPCYGTRWPTHAHSHWWAQAAAATPRCRGGMLLGRAHHRAGAEDAAQQARKTPQKRYASHRVRENSGVALLRMSARQQFELFEKLFETWWFLLKGGSAPPPPSAAYGSTVDVEARCTERCTARERGWARRPHWGRRSGTHPPPNVPTPERHLPVTCEGPSRLPAGTTKSLSRSFSGTRGTQRAA